jgi:hypothetical protein
MRHSATVPPGRPRTGRSPGPACECPPPRRLRSCCSTVPLVTTNGTHPAARASRSALATALSGIICLTSPPRSSARSPASPRSPSPNRSLMIAASRSRGSRPSLSAATSHCASGALPPRAEANSRAQRPNAPARSMRVLSRSTRSSGTPGTLTPGACRPSNFTTRGQLALRAKDSTDSRRRRRRSRSHGRRWILPTLHNVHYRHPMRLGRCVRRGRVSRRQGLLLARSVTT